MEKWIGKVALVTGASSGIGAAAVEALAEHGLGIVVGLSRREDDSEKLSASGGKIYFKKCDINIEEDVLKIFKWIEDNYGGVDILINNAGVIKPRGLVNGTTEDWKNVLDTNVLSLSVCTREAIKTMRKCGDNGHIIHINSVAGHFVPQFKHLPLGMYPASKFAVTALTETLRVELQSLNSNIKITSISPGTVYTEMVRNLTSGITGKPVEEVGPTPPKHLEVRDVVDSIIYTLSTRPNVQVHDIIIQPLGQQLA